MRIEWLDDIPSRAVITVGWWRWTKRATVRLPCEYAEWVFDGTELDVGSWMGRRLRKARDEFQNRRQRAARRLGEERTRENEARLEAERVKQWSRAENFPTARMRVR